MNYKTVVFTMMCMLAFVLACSKKEDLRWRKESMDEVATKIARSEYNLEKCEASMATQSNTEGVYNVHGACISRSGARLNYTSSILKYNGEPVILSTRFFR